MVKFKKRMLWLFLAVILFAFSACQVKEIDPCDETQWEQMVNYSIQPKLKVAQSHLPDDKNLKDAANLNVIAKLLKVHCGEDLGVFRDLNSNHDPGAIDDEFWMNGFYIGKVYGFDFDNSEDFLRCTCNIIATFEDGKKYVLIDPISIEVKPPFGFDWDRSFFYITVTPDMDWALY